MDLISSIALLCQLSIGAGTSNGFWKAETIISHIEAKQTLCQKYYARCMLTSEGRNSQRDMLNCIKTREMSLKLEKK